MIGMDRLESSELLARIERLERRNRVLTRLCALTLAVPALALVGWQSVGAPEVIRARRIEVVDERGVPLVTLGTDRTSDGGVVTLRDKLGEKRSWWQVGPGTAALTLNSDSADGTSDSTLGLSVGPKSSRMSLLSKDGASLSASMQGNQPKIELYNTRGGPLFIAPWTPAKKTP